MQMKNLKMRTCKICSRTFSKPYNLRVHHARFHPAEDPPELERMARNKIEDQMNQYGTGDIFSNRSDSDDEEDEDMDSASDVSDNEDIDSDSDRSDNEDKEERENDNSIFDSMIDETVKELGENPSGRAVRKLFCKKFGNRLVWYYELRKHPIYKKVMETVNFLQENPGDFDRIEAMWAAIKQRKILFERLIDDKMSTDNDKSDGSDDDEEVDTGADDEEEVDTGDVGV